MVSASSLAWVLAGLELLWVSRVLLGVVGLFLWWFSEVLDMSENQVSVRLKLGEKGKLSIPVAVREGAGFEVGEVLALKVLEPGVVQLSSVRVDLGALQGKYGAGL